MSGISFVIPVYNPGNDFKQILNSIKLYESESHYDTEIIVVDSSPSANTTDFVRNDSSVNVIKIESSNFNHGGTRNQAFNISKGEYVVFLTQDAVPSSPECFKKIIKNMEKDPSIGMAYGRQLPKRDAKLFSKLARDFNYPSQSRVKSLKDKDNLGIKTVFVSDSFAAYRRSALIDVGGFPRNTILSEETFVAAKMLTKGYSIAYEADACVYHSHNYTCIQEFKRYFDTGVFYGRENWITKKFAHAESEGRKFIIYQLREIISFHYFHLIPEFLFRNALKYVGYKLGTMEKYIPLRIKKKISMNTNYWENWGSK
ncbi:glycosyltransferase family 2 protein [Sporolactobacillus sp. THM19-2]|uniref:glycosyltransferase family 2 protein n=1 Tax=Sporolactobacillus sp. THM19-2 TaxID=2511171 RepID=UPI00101EEAE6|nr:glycosyltransferase family 2 protein [Sporolactobacillus sp. THM19-2]RYL93937.1 glycosyltransferase family 2 protein [Sporolactobacillus sp. THM19-2]